QGAHEAIRPTAMDNPGAARLAGDDKRVYELIWRRTLVCQMSSAKLERTTVTVRPEGHAWRLLAIGSVVVEPGFLAFVGRGDDKDTELPRVTVGQVLTLRDMVLTESKTKPPPRFTTRSLIRYLERRGIGRPSTYAGV